MQFSWLANPKLLLFINIKVCMKRLQKPQNWPHLWRDLKGSFSFPASRGFRSVCVNCKMFASCPYFHWFWASIKLEPTMKCYKVNVLNLIVYFRTWMIISYIYHQTSALININFNCFPFSQAPVNDTTATGGFLGLNASTTRAHLVRAMLESLAFRIYQIYRAMLTEADYELLSLRYWGCHCYCIRHQSFWLFILEGVILYHYCLILHTLCSPHELCMSPSRYKCYISCCKDSTCWISCIHFQVSPQHRYFLYFPYKSLLQSKKIYLFVLHSKLEATFFCQVYRNKWHDFGDYNTSILMSDMLF